MKVDIFNTDKKYSIIYADPPWEFSSKQLQKVNGTRFHSLNEEYITTSTKSMCAWGGNRQYRYTRQRDFYVEYGRAFKRGYCSYGSVGL